MADKHLDCKELNCPIPIVRISKAIKEMSPGQTLSVEATDMAFKADLKAWVQKMGHEIVDLTNNGQVQQAIIRKCG
jgi:tRNA 2-thiouridine synthesizing protein A